MSDEKTLVRRVYEVTVTLLTTGSREAALTELKELSKGVIEEVEYDGSFEGAGTSCMSDNLNEDSFSTQIVERVMGDWDVLVSGDASSITHDAYRCIGTISKGTLRPEDLIPTYMNELCVHNPDTYNTNIKEWFIETTQKGENFWTKEALSWSECLYDDLYDMTDMLHTYLVFGAHPDDPADIGYWVDHEAVADAIENHELMSFASLEDAEKFYQGTHRQHIKPRFVITKGDGYYESMHCAESGLTFWNHNS